MCTFIVESEHLTDLSMGRHDEHLLEQATKPHVLTLRFQLQQCRTDGLRRTGRSRPPLGNQNAGQAEQQGPSWLTGVPPTASKSQQTAELATASAGTRCCKHQLLPDCQAAQQGGIARMP